MKTKQLIITVLLMACIATPAISQEAAPQKNESVVYAFVLNIVPDGFNAPLIGFVNIARGDHKGAQLGFVNTNAKSFSGLQAGYVNTIGGASKGVQAGFINTCGSSVQGGQYGFVNTTAGTLQGAQIGFINTTAKQVKGVQAGFVNTAADTFQGAQLGYINTASKRIEGTQIGFVNGTRSLKGTQLGFINYADSLESGVPIGFFSFVRKGGFQAIDAGYMGAHPYSLSFRTGVNKFYTSFILAYNPQADKGFATGGGIGAILPVGRGFYFNPELISMSSIGTYNEHTSTLTPSFGYAVTPHIHFVAGPTLNWSYSIEEDELLNASGNLFVHDINTQNKMIVGLRASVRFALSGLTLR